MTATRIDRFKGEFGWLSNFAPVRVVLDGETFDSVEAAYQAAKTLDGEERAAIRAAATPAMARRRGRRVTLRPDWEQVKLDIMLDLLRQKFSHPDLRAKLLATGDAELVEGNTWNDRYWGVAGTGLNMLGKLLSVVRQEARSGRTGGQRA